MIALATCRVAHSRTTAFVGLWGSGLPVSPTEKSAARYTKAASTMWHTMAVCTRTDTHEACKQSVDKVQTKCRVVYTTFCIEYQ